MKRREVLFLAGLASVTLLIPGAFSAPAAEEKVTLAISGMT